MEQLTEEEEELVANFRTMSESDRARILNVLENVARAGGKMSRVQIKELFESDSAYPIQ